MTNNISFITKIIFAVSLAFVLSFSIIYYVVFENYKTVLLEEQAKKINILLNTISPSVEINLEFNMLDNIDTLFIQLLRSNDEIKAVKLIDLYNTTLAKQVVTKDYKNIIVRTKPIKDNITKKVIGYLKISYSNKSYLDAIIKFQNMFIYIAIGFIIFIILFMQLLFYVFRPLKNISNKLSSFDPENPESFKMEN